MAVGRGAGATEAVRFCASAGGPSLAAASRQIALVTAPGLIGDARSRAAAAAAAKWRAVAIGAGKCWAGAGEVA